MVISELRTIVSAWARQEPRVSHIYLFGSRAKGTASAKSDIDLAMIVTDEPDYSAVAFGIIEKKRFKESLAPLLPHPLDLQFAFVEDTVVMPAVIEHGILLYEAIDQAKSKLTHL